MTMLSIRQTQFMTAKKIAEEQDARITTIENELGCKHISAEHRCELAKLKRVLNDRTSKSFANIVYASQQQEVKYVEIKHLIDNYKVLAESKKLNPDDVYFVTINQYRWYALSCRKLPGAYPCGAAPSGGLPDRVPSAPSACRWCG